MVLVEECAGTGTLMRDDDVVSEVRYQLKVLQETFAGNGLPVPWLRTVEGSLDFGGRHAAGDLVGADMTLRLEDGRRIGITLVDASGGIRQRSHGHGSCACC